MRAVLCVVFFFSSRRRHTRLQGDWSSDVCSSDLLELSALRRGGRERPREVGARPAVLRAQGRALCVCPPRQEDRKSTRLNSSHLVISYAVFCLKKKKNTRNASAVSNKKLPI